MENKTTHKQKPAYGMASNCAFMIRWAWRECKGVLSVCAGLVFCGVAASLLELFVVPAILKAVEGGAAPGALVRLILWFTLGMVLVRAFRAYLDENTLFGRVTVRSSLCLDLHMHFCRTSFPHTEDPDYIKRVRKASRCLDSNRDSGEAVWKTMTDLTTNVISFLIYLLLLAQAGPWVAGLCMVLAAAGYFAGEHIRSWRYRHREEEGRLNSHLDYMIARSRDIQLAKDIRIFGIGPWLTELYDKYGRLCQDFYAKSYRFCLWADLLDLGLALARNGAAYGLLIAMAIRGELTAAEFVLYFTAVSGFAQWVTGIFAQLGTLHRQSLELSTLREVMETEEPFRFEDGKPLAVKENHLYQLELRDVSFRYPGAEEDTLSHVNLTIRPGEKLAVVGRNGAGKTTLIKLLCGLYDPTQGQVLLDGEDIRQYDRRDYYRHFSAVFQQFSTLAGTMAENVAQASGGELDRDRVGLPGEGGGGGQDPGAAPAGGHPAGPGGLSGRGGPVRGPAPAADAGPRAVQKRPGGGAGRADGGPGPHRGERSVPEVQRPDGEPDQRVYLPPAGVHPVLRPGAAHRKRRHRRGGHPRVAFGAGRAVRLPVQHPEQVL